MRVQFFGYTQSLLVNHESDEFACSSAASYISLF